MHIHQFSRKFRKASVENRREWITDNSETEESRSDFAFSGADENLLHLSEAMVEQAIGYIGIPLGLAGPFLIDDEQLMIPMATEEPSVIAAASYAGTLIARHGGISTFASEPVMVAQIFIEDTGASGPAGVKKIMDCEEEIRSHLAKILASMEARGGGWRGMDARWIAPSRTLAVNLRIDVRDAMGANLLNSSAEKIRSLVEKISQGRVLMGILSNRCWDRTARARIALPVAALKRPGYSGEETARRIVRSARIAREDPDRAVTHNKGIMNGISALALASANDCRAIEAAVHAYAGRYGPYHGLSEYWIEEDCLHGSLEMPLPFAVTGGAVGYHPTSRWVLQMLGQPDAKRLSRIAAALGLAQNFAALRALVSEGIQQGHMRLHARRLSYSAGARGEAIGEFAAAVEKQGIRSKDDAAELFSHWNTRIEE